MTSAGHMAKGPGLHQAGGHSYTLKVCYQSHFEEWESHLVCKSGNTRPETLTKIADQADLSVQLDEATSSMCSFLHDIISA
jgi:hypothetical protein